MKYIYITIALCFVFMTYSCSSSRSAMSSGRAVYDSQTEISQSLFLSKDTTISEQNIHTVLNGKAKLPQQLRIAIINLNNYGYNVKYYGGENYAATQQLYQDTFIDEIKKSDRVQTVSVIPNILLAGNRNITLDNIRTAAVRMQCDLIIVYSISGGLYSKKYHFSKDKYNAYGQAQAFLVDVRTALVPYSMQKVNEYSSNKLDTDSNKDFGKRRTVQEAVLNAIEGLTQSLVEFLDMEQK